METATTDVADLVSQSTACPIKTRPRQFYHGFSPVEVATARNDNTTLNNINMMETATIDAADLVSQSTCLENI